MIATDFLINKILLYVLKLYIFIIKKKKRLISNYINKRRDKGKS